MEDWLCWDQGDAMTSSGTHTHCHSLVARHRVEAQHSNSRTEGKAGRQQADTVHHKINNVKT